MGGLILPSAIPVVTEFRQYFNPEIPLLFFVGYYGIRHKGELVLWPLSEEPAGELLLQDNLKVGAADGLPETEKQRGLEIRKGVGFFEIGFFVRFSSSDSVRRFEPKFSIQFDKEEPADTQKGEAEKPQ